jgi:hypothetical protein
VGEGETYRGRQRQRETGRYKEQVEEGGIQAKKTEVDKAGRDRNRQMHGETGIGGERKKQT